MKEVVFHTVAVHAPANGVKESSSGVGEKQFYRGSRGTSNVGLSPEGNMT